MNIEEFDYMSFVFDIKLRVSKGVRHLELTEKGFQGVVEEDVEWVSKQAISEYRLMRGGSFG